MGRNRGQIGRNSTRNGVENGANPGESGPSDTGRSSRNRGPRPKRRLAATRGNDINHGRLNFEPADGRARGGWVRLGRVGWCREGGGKLASFRTWMQGDWVRFAAGLSRF